MKKIIGIIHPFDVYQIFYVYEDGNKLEIVHTKISDIPDTVFELSRAYDVYQVDLSGAEHFALNCVYTECRECHKVEKGNFDTCPHCGSKRLNHFSRVIGYFSLIENWNPTRRKEDFPNRKFIKADQLKEQLEI